MKIVFLFENLAFSDLEYYDFAQSNPITLAPIACKKSRCSIKPLIVSSFTINKECTEPCVTNLITQSVYVSKRQYHESYLLPLIPVSQAIPSLTHCSKYSLYQFKVNRHLSNQSVQCPILFSAFILLSLLKASVQRKWAQY